MKKVWKIIGIIVATMVVLMGIMLFVVCKDIPKQSAVAIHSIDITNLQDGTYIGAYQFSRWESKVQVTVKEGKITDIQSLKEVFPDVTGAINAAIIKEQRNDVDAVSGATATSKAYQKAVENALIQGGGQ